MPASVNFIATMASSCSVSFIVMAAWRNAFDDRNTASFTTVVTLHITKDLAEDSGMSHRSTTEGARDSLGHVMIESTTSC